MLEIDGTDEVALAVRVSGRDVLRVWNRCRKALRGMEVWPVVTMGWGTHWEPALHAADIFTRYGFEQERLSGRPLAVKTVLRKSREIDLQAALMQLARDDAWHELIDTELDCTRRRFGKAPSRKAVLDGRLNGRRIANTVDLDRWLLEWEIRSFGRRLAASRPDVSRLVRDTTTAHHARPPPRIGLRSGRRRRRLPRIDALARWEQPHPVGDVDCARAVLE